MQATRSGEGGYATVRHLRPPVGGPLKNEGDRAAMGIVTPPCRENWGTASSWAACLQQYHPLGLVTVQLGRTPGPPLQGWAPLQGSGALLRSDQAAQHSLHCLLHGLLVQLGRYVDLLQR